MCNGCTAGLYIIFNIFLNDLFYFVKEGNMYNYADDSSISVSHKELTNLSRQLQTEAEFTVQCFFDNAMEANPTKFHCPWARALSVQNCLSRDWAALDRDTANS